jgi:predicted MPP superfamily phosphohydrolase
MRTFFLVIIIALVLIEFYVFRGVRSVFITGGLKAFYVIYYLTVLMTLAGIFSMFLAFGKGIGETNLLLNTLFGIAFTLIIIKILIAGFLVMEDIYRIIRFLIEMLVSGGKAGLVARSGLLARSVLILCSLLFALYMYGLFYGKYNYKVRNIALDYADLPREFEGFRILQISDIHSGTIDNMSAVKRGIELMKRQDADLILFTGDLVNNFADEIKPYTGLFASLSAPYGKYSILGNHDYGHYYKWPSEDARIANMEKLYSYHDTMGFRLLRNECIRIGKGNDTILLAGVENWGKPPFDQYGDLDKTFRNHTDSLFTILMSHDPSHWDRQVLGFGRHIHLTLSGHTHGMQMGIEIGRFKWSPVKLFYPNWAGLYENNSKKLYVNRGFGFIGFPGRVGIWPEITVIELRGR